ncbi:hypothetical protein D1872_295280 [compost metagenome]
MQREDDQILQGEPDTGDKLLLAQRFLQHAADTHFDKMIVMIGHILPRQDDDPGFGPPLERRLGQLKPVHPRKLEIEQIQIKGRFFHQY